MKKKITEYPNYSGMGTTDGGQQATTPASPTVNPPKVSPSSAQKKPAAAQPMLAKASDLQVDDEFPDAQGNVVKVVSPAGQKLNSVGFDAEDVLVVQDQKTKKIYAIDPETKIALPQVKEKRNRVLEQAIFEVNFNSPALINQVLDANIECGFEAELVWNLPSSTIPDDVSYYSGFVQDAMSYVTQRKIQKNFETYLWHTEGEALFKQKIEERLAEEEDDQETLDQYVKEVVATDLVDEYRATQLASSKEELDPDEYEEEKDRPMDSWAREYVEVNEYREYREWLYYIIEERLVEEGVREELLSELGEATSIDEWAAEEYGSVAEMLHAHDAQLNIGDSPLETVVDFVEEWATSSSQFKKVKSHESASSEKEVLSHWVITTDQSISVNDRNSQEGFELISPVYKSPRNMLREMSSLFAWLQENDLAETNESTGLHVTMSLPNKQQSANRVKMAVLLGDKYLLKQFGREDNVYTVSRQAEIEELVNEFNKDPKSNIVELEDFLARFLPDKKYASINFKSAKNTSGNQLIEFRVGGGKDYEKDFKRLAVSVVRYSTVMLAGHDPKFLLDDYIKKLYKLLDSIEIIDKPDTLSASGIIEIYKQLPHLQYDVYRHQSAKDRTISLVLHIAAALNFGSLSSSLLSTSAKGYIARQVKKTDSLVEIRTYLKELGLLHVMPVIFAKVTEVTQVPFRDKKVGAMRWLVPVSQYSLVNKYGVVGPATKIRSTDSSRIINAIAMELVIRSPDEEYNQRNVFGDRLKNESDIDVSEVYHSGPGVMSIMNSSHDMYQEVLALPKPTPDQLDVVERLSLSTLYTVVEEGKASSSALSLNEELELLSKVSASTLRRTASKVLESAVPESRLPQQLVKIMQNPVKASDLKTQMKVYYAIPVPGMISDFRKHRAMMGDDADLRSIIKQYAQQYLHDSVQNKITRIQKRESN